MTAKAIPKDVDLLVTIDSTMDLTRLARAGRRLMGSTQSINLGADVFLADVAGRYLGPICYYRECRPRAACRAEHRGRRQHLNDDLHVVTLSKDLLTAPPADLWPRVVRRLVLPADVEEILLAQLEQAQRAASAAPLSAKDRCRFAPHPAFEVRGEINRMCAAAFGGISAAGPARWRDRL